MVLEMTERQINEFIVKNLIKIGPSNPKKLRAEPEL